VIKEKSKKRKSINIKSTVKIKGYTFKITAIGKKAFYKNKGLTSIKVGKNIVKIDSYAFYGCTKLKSVKIYSTKLKTVGKKAFGKTEKNIVVQVPKKTKKLLKKYKSLLRKKGISKYTVFRY
uniref:leucine-rich repeat protein n=1 Tax=Waltera sp. TaxID=2815806 RepID=UPI003AB4ACC1